MTSLSVERHLAQHLAQLRYEDISTEAEDAGKLLLFDTLADIVASLRSDSCRLIRDTWVEGSNGPCGVPGSVRRAAPTTASFINGVFAHWYEWDDVHSPGILHASAVLFPVLLAAAEAGGKVAGPDAWREFISTAVASFDVAARTSESIVGSIHNGWMPTGIAAIGAAGGAARLLGLDTDGIHSAMGIAGSTIGVSRQAIKDKANGKNILCGLVAETAMRAALLARAGIQGPPDFLFGEFGASTLFAGGEASPSVALSELGRRFSILESSIKLYPCCQSTHGCIDIVLDLAAEEPIAPEKVEKIELLLPRKNFQLVGAPFVLGPDARVAAQFSVAYTVALAICRGTPSIGHFDAAAIRSGTDILELADRIEVRVNDKAVHEVRLHLRDGSTRNGSTSILKGSPLRPASESEKRRKIDDALSILDPRTQISGLDGLIHNNAAPSIGRISTWLSEVQTSFPAAAANPDPAVT